MLLHRTNSRRMSTRGVRRIRAHQLPQSEHDGSGQNDSRCIRVRGCLSDHFVRTAHVIAARGQWPVVLGAADSFPGSAESWSAAVVVSFLAVAGPWFVVAVSVSAGSVLGSSLAALASAASLAVAASPVSPALVLQV